MASSGEGVMSFSGGAALVLPVGVGQMLQVSSHDPGPQLVLMRAARSSTVQTAAVAASAGLRQGRADWA